MRQVCNVVYHVLTDGRTTAQIAELDVALSDPRDREKMIGRQNVEAMKQLQATGGHGFIRPPARPRKPRGGE